MKKGISIVVACAMMLSSVGLAHADSKNGALLITASNAVSGNELMVYDTSGNLVETLPTGGLGGVAGNAGGVAAQSNMIAVVNFGSQSVSIFSRSGSTISFVEQFSTASKPVSVAFGKDHLYVLGQTTVESHAVSGNSVNPVADGTVGLVHADNSAAQVGVLSHELVITEKSNTVETVSLSAGAVAGNASAVSIPTGSDTPFGLVTRGENAYVTIAHSDEIATIAHDQVSDITTSGGQHAPCWLALSGQYLYSANSPSKSISLYTVTGNTMTLATEVAASLSGSPTDIASDAGIVAVIDGSKHLTTYTIGAGGSLTELVSVATGVATNGVVIVN